MLSQCSLALKIVFAPCFLKTVVEVKGSGLSHDLKMLLG